MAPTVFSCRFVKGEQMEPSPFGLGDVKHIILILDIFSPMLVFCIKNGMCTSTS